VTALEPRAFLRRLFDAAVAAADPALLLPGRLPPPPRGRAVVVGAGKAAAAMARAVELEAAARWGEKVDALEGLVVTRDGHGVPCERIEVVEAAHPVPDARGREAAARILDLARGLAADDLLICLISGGGSALLSLPTPGVSLEDKRMTNKSLLRSGASITEMNCVRKHLSAIKGGRLAAAAHPARVITYLISDVPGDDPSVIASGPTVPDPSTFADARGVLERRGVAVPHGAYETLAAGAQGDAEETPKPGDAAFADDQVVILATAASALQAAAMAAQEEDVHPVLLGDDLEGEARDLGGLHAALALDCSGSSERRIASLRKATAKGAARIDGSIPAVPPRPLVLLSGGETTVTVRGSGRGGRDAEYALALALGLNAHPAVWALAADTDGIDGTEDNAGAFVAPDSLSMMRTAGIDPVAALAANDAYGAFAAIGDLLVTGPTLTNVNDFRAILVLDDQAR
jgi:glycerate 2-kinase